MPKRREMNPAGKRAKIIASAEALFVAQGYTGTSIADVAREADVAVGTVYRLFPDKPALLAALHIRMEDAFIEAMQTGWSSTPRYEDRFGPMISAILDKVSDISEVMPLYAMTRDLIGATDYIPNVRMISTIAELYAEGVQAGAFRPVPADIQAPLAHAMVEGGMRAWMNDPTPENLTRIKAELTKVFCLAFLS